MTSRRLAGTASALAALFALVALDAAAQPARRVHRIGVLNEAWAASHPTVEGLKAGLRELGIEEGRNATFDIRFTEGKLEAMPAAAMALAKAGVDLIVTSQYTATQAARDATTRIPIVFTLVSDPVAAGLVANPARPEGNVTGVTSLQAELVAKRLEILKEVMPAAKRVAVLWNAGDNAMTLRYREIEKAAGVLRMGIEPLGVREPDDFDGALTAMSRTRPDALMMVTDALTSLNRQRVIDYAATHKIPAMYEFASVVQAGGLMSYGTDQGETLKLAADYIAKVLKGAKPGDLPVEQPNRYFLVINLKTAKALGLTVPQSLLLRADEVIQ